MQRLEVSGAVRPIYESLGVKRLIKSVDKNPHLVKIGQKFRKLYVKTSLRWYCWQRCI